MADYKGNFYSKDAYAPSYSGLTRSGVFKSRVVSTAEATADKFVVIEDKDVEHIVIATIYRADTAMTGYKLASTVVDGVKTTYITSPDTGYVLTADDVIVYYATIVE